MKTQHTLHEDPTYFIWRPNILYMKTQHTLHEDPTYFTWRPNILYTKTQHTLHEDPTYFLSYLAQLFLEGKMFQTKFVDKIKTIFMFNYFFFQSCYLWDDVEKSCTAGQTTDDNMAHAHGMLDT